ncbi:hypothetical protein SAMN05216223_11632 [Actinacidiphila yanglinensis]|uniref:Uncharacterized protein n=1 Tax=Actinacidiphila yanglinensis TaxID=310779 RepID=A0A1H6DJ85_9ACTN|nr:hypothetical protein SAMN05216223_11632 [Actinacidiphila yanglinensis]
MEPGPAVSLPQRIWTVAITTRFGASGASCGACGPLQHLPDQALRTTALHHLALHARSDVTPPHLRVCQCGHRGCPWHGRHRGCAGPVLLTLTCTPTVGTWRLADLCHQCALTTPHTTPVPHHTPAVAASHSRRPTTAPTMDTDEEQPVVWETACPSCNTQDGNCAQSCLSQ